eukprot:12263273-Prorocentrum_lima.AAC.1
MSKQQTCNISRTYKASHRLPFSILEDVPWTCPGCIEHRQRSHPSHTHMPDKCKFFKQPRLQGRE